MLNEYRFTYTKAPNNCTTVCIQRGIEMMTFTKRIKGRPNRKAIYLRMMCDAATLISGKTFHKWCSNHGHVAEQWRKPMYEQVVKLRDDMLRLRLLTAQ